MTFLVLRRATPWLVSLAAVGCGSGADLAPADASSVTADAAASADTAGPIVDLVAPRACTTGGTGRLRVSLALDPGVALRSPEVWLLVRCGATVERVLRWDRLATQTVDALGPGNYEVVASSFVAPWSTSTRVTLGEGATAALSVTLPPGPSALAQLRSSPAAGAASTPWRASVGLASADTAASVASLEVEVLPYASDPPSAEDARFLSVTAVVRNPCASGRCPPYQLRALEIRTREGDGPVGLGGFLFPDGERLEPGESKSIPQPMVVRGAMPDTTHGLEVVLYGAVVRPEARRP